MRLRAMSREEAEAYEPRADYEVCISISDPGYPPAELSDGFEDVLQLAVSDLDIRFLPHLEKMTDEDWERENLELFRASHAQQILAFCRRHRGADALIAHCHAGVSRSVGVVRAIAELRGLTPSESRQAHGRGNLLIRERILELARGLGL